MTIDWWTLGIQTVNVAILVWLLGRFFWKPVAAMIETRRAAAQRLIDDAGALRGKAADELADIEKTRAGLSQEREAMLVAAQKAAEAAQAARLKEAEGEAAALEAAAKVSIDKTAAAEAARWAARSTDLAVAIARRLAARLDGAAVQACFVDWLTAEIASLPASVRQSAGADGVVLEAVTADEIDEQARQAITVSIHKALGGAPRIDFRTDPELIAGIELRGDHLIIDSSWRADLAAIQAGLKTEAVT